MHYVEAMNTKDNLFLDNKDNYLMHKNNNIITMMALSGETDDARITNCRGLIKSTKK